MPFDKFLELAYRYGSPVFYSAVFAFGLYKLGVRVLNSYEKREMSYAAIINTGMANITSALQELSKAQQLNLQMYERVSKELKDGFDRQHDASKYLREEHKEIIGLIAQGQRDAAEARERIMGKIDESECRAK